MVTEWTKTYAHILELEAKGIVKRTFRRLDPERQQKVIGAILDEAGANGPADLNIKNVADRAGVSVGSLYQYFGNREGLLSFSIELVTKSVLDAFSEYRPYLAALPLREAFIAYLGGGLEWSQEQAGFVRFFTRAAYQGDPVLGAQVVKPVAEVMLEIVREILQAAIQRGEVRADIDLDATSRTIHALTIALGDPFLLPYLNQYFLVNSLDVPVERIIEAMLELVTHGIGAPEGKI